MKLVVARWDADKWAKRLAVSSGVILGFAGMAKIWTALNGGSEVLTIADPVLGIKYKKLMLAVGFVEIIVALICILAKNQTIVPKLIAWIASCFAAYRIGLWWINWTFPCHCLGNLTDALHIPEETADRIMKLILAYLLVGSYSLIVIQWLKKRQIE
jgi:hypothetical protein